jgi:hypothetical protein
MHWLQFSNTFQAWVASFPYHRDANHGWCFHGGLVEEGVDPFGNGRKQIPLATWRPGFSLWIDQCNTPSPNHPKKTQLTPP